MRAGDQGLCDWGGTARDKAGARRPDGRGERNPYKRLPDQLLPPPASRRKRALKVDIYKFNKSLLKKIMDVGPHTATAQKYIQNTAEYFHAPRILSAIFALLRRRAQMYSDSALPHFLNMNFYLWTDATL